MIFHLHYILLTSGLSGTSVLLAVYFKTYSDASPAETGTVLMAMPFVNLFIKPIFCSMADRHQSHHLSLMLALLVMMIGYAPFLVVPFFPAFYEHYPRHSWYLQAAACLVGSAGLGVAWSLGDCLAVNHSQRTGVPFGRMRLMGTLSWGVYGFIIGQINEHPALPKYLPAFLILHLSVAAELLLLLFWDRRAFEMVDLMADQTLTLGVSDEKRIQQQQQERHQHSFAAMSQEDNEQLERELDAIRIRNKQMDNLADSVPSSLGGTLKINPKAARALFGAFAANDEELVRRLNVVEQQQQQQASECNSIAPADLNNSINGSLNVAKQQQQQQPQMDHLTTIAEKTPDGCEKGQTRPSAANGRNPQLVLLKMILVEDGRVLKYIVLFTAFGVFMAPLTFFFVSLESLCHERGYNFSQLAGAVLISQALIETLTFVVAPHLLNYLSRWSLLCFGLAIMSMKYVFYAGWFYNDNVSPYWAVLAEWSHGIPYGIFCTIMADVSLMFANQSRLFIPELRRLNFITDNTSGLSREFIEAEERSIKMALRATMQALFGGFMDGLGQGAGALLCGLISDLFSYLIVWQIFATITITVFLAHFIVEITGSRWSDSFRPAKGTKAFEIMELSRAATEAQSAKRLQEKEQKKFKSGASGGVAVAGSSGQKCLQVSADGDCDKSQAPTL